MISETAFAKLINLVKAGKNHEIECIAENSSRPSLLTDYTGVTLLHLAAKFDNVELIDFLLDSKHSDIESKTCTGVTPLLMSAVHASYDAAKRLLDAGADVFATDDNDVSVLRVLLNPRRNAPLEILKLLGGQLGKRVGGCPGKMLEIFRKVGARSESMLLINEPKLIRCVLNEVTMDSERSVKLAMDLGYVDVLGVLVRFGHQSRERRKILMETLTKIITSPTPNLEFAKPVVEKLIPWNVIDEAAIEQSQKIFGKGSQEAVQLMIDCEIDLRVRGAFGRDFLKHMFRNPNVDVIELLRSRFDADERDVDGYSLLHLAVIFKPMDFVQRMLDLGVDPNSKDRDGRTALFYATDADCMELLLRSGADIQAIDDEGNTMIDETRDELPLLQLVIAHLANRDRLAKKVLDDVDNDEEVKRMFDDCREQLRWMNRQKVHRDNTLYSLLGATGDEELTGYPIKTRDAVTSTLSFMVKRGFNPYYVAKLERKMTRAFEFHAMRFGITEAVSEAIGVHDPNHLVVERVVGFLSFEDIVKRVEFSM